MRDDMPAGVDAGRAVGQPEAGVDERWPWWTGDRRRTLVFAAAGALVVPGALSMAWTWLMITTPHPAPPWVQASLVASSALAVLAALLVVRQLLADGGARSRTAEPLTPPSLTHLQVDTSSGRRVIAADELEWIQADGNYARLHLPGGSFLYRLPLARLERELDGRRFLRVHRSAIVNLEAVERIVPLPSGDGELALSSGAQVRLSRRYAKAFHERTGRPY